MTEQAHWSSLIELLHPSGAPRAVRVIGSACPEGIALCPQRRDNRALRPDMVVLAPNDEEATNSDWLRQASHEASDLIDGDGLLYALARRPWRRSLLRLLQECELEIESIYLHHPSWPRTELLIPAEYHAISYAYSRLIHTDPNRRRAALAALRAPGALAVAVRLIGETGLVARRSGSQPSLSWLSEGIGQAGSTVAQASWRGQEGAVLLHAFTGKNAPSTIVKVWLSETGLDAFEREVDGLELAARTVAGAGNRVPVLVRQGMLNGRPYLVESVLRGEKAAEILGRDPSRLLDALSGITAWLGEWGAKSLTTRLFSADDLERFALAPARALRGELGMGKAYEARLRALGERLIAQPTPSVAAHGDLTMVNVLVDKRGQLSVIDWETASAAGLPLMDFYYAAVDAVAATTGYADRVAAWESCFGHGGEQEELVRALERCLADMIGVNDDLLMFSFHACWLHHALLERRETAKAAPREFLDIAHRAASSLLERASGSRGP